MQGNLTMHCSAKPPNQLTIHVLKYAADNLAFVFSFGRMMCFLEEVRGVGSSLDPLIHTLLEWFPLSDFLHQCGICIPRCRRHLGKQEAAVKLNSVVCRDHRCRDVWSLMGKESLCVSPILILK